MVEVAGLIAIGAGLAIGIAACGSGIGQGIASAAGAGATAENEKLLGKMMVFAALAASFISIDKTGSIGDCSVVRSCLTMSFSRNPCRAETR